MADEEGVDDATLIAEISARDAEVSGFLAKKDKVNAMKSCLKSPPVESKSMEVKVGLFMLRIGALNIGLKWVLGVLDCMPCFDVVSLMFFLFQFLFLLLFS